MNWLDWAILAGTILFIVLYGTWKNRKTKNMDSYFRNDERVKWFTIGISVMATQASAVTFISVPGQAFEDGMRFAQFYFGLPLAMIVISAVFVPVYYKLKVYTAYEFLENRFNTSTRLFTAGIFLLQRGLAAGITIYAPSIVLSTVLGWDLYFANIVIGLLVTLYTAIGGTQAVNQTQKQQMAVMMGGMIVAAGVLTWYITRDISFSKAMDLASLENKTRVITTSFSWDDRYNIFSGLIGGFFVALAYFGTDQSQVARYLGGKSMKEVRAGLFFNGLFKIPMQLLILFAGVLVFVFYQLHQPPVFYNGTELNNLRNSTFTGQLQDFEQEFTTLHQERKDLITSDHSVSELAPQLRELNERELEIRKNVKVLAKENNQQAVTKDTDYVFLSFILGYLPHGMIGLLLSVILCAAMSSTASELNALAACTTVDIYKRCFRKEASERHFVNISKLFTVGWGILGIIFATIFSLFDNLIQAVNIIGSLFYGTVLGIFLSALIFKKINTTGVLTGAILSQSTILVLHILSYPKLVSKLHGWLEPFFGSVMPVNPEPLKFSYLWYNPIGAIIVVVIGFIISFLFPGKKKSPGISQ